MIFRAMVSLRLRVILREVVDTSREAGIVFAGSGRANVGPTDMVEVSGVRREESACVGRRPDGFSVTPMASAPSVGAWFANAAQLEAASVHAFRILHDELLAHGAPERLAVAAERAARDEIRHAAMMRRLARRYGASNVPEVDVQAKPDRSLDAIALENAVEGCVRETYGAVEAALQGERATDPLVARIMRAIAHDEAKHAELAWDVAAWARNGLDVETRTAIDVAMHGAVSDLLRELRRDTDPSLARLAGLPSKRVAMHAASALQAKLWARAS
ncbi:putative lipoprotein [Labilithrix luteola]|uniref:Putative lipoprotein n=2 Tax=Labilithrix luteola TaxID=1391654 RepID=A0A0K1Q2Z9_9BACT|nr:putative lipoprotein [Labilithrix luteola]